jgi:hypothetical protein
MDEVLDVKVVGLVLLLRAGISGVGKDEDASQLQEMLSTVILMRAEIERLRGIEDKLLALQKFAGVI